MTNKVQTASTQYPIFVVMQDISCFYNAQDEIATQENDIAESLSVAHQEIKQACEIMTLQDECIRFHHSQYSYSDDLFKCFIACESEQQLQEKLDNLLDYPVSVLSLMSYCQRKNYQRDSPCSFEDSIEDRPKMIAED